MRFMNIILMTTIFGYCGSGKNSALEPIEYRLVNSNGGLTLRQEPSREAKKISIIPDGEPVRILRNSEKQESIDGTLGTWVYIEQKQNQGWVFSGFLTPASFQDKCIKEFSYDSSQYKTPKWSIHQVCGQTKESLLANNYWYYRSWWRDQEGEYLQAPNRERQRTILKDIGKDVKIIEIRDKVALVEHTSTALDYATFTTNADIWVFEENFWHFYEGVHGWGKSRIFDANDDTLPDVITEYGCCGNMRVKVFLGSNSKIIEKVLDTYFFEGAKFEVKLGKCSDFKIFGKNPERNQDVLYSLDCKKNKMIQK